MASTSLTFRCPGEVLEAIDNLGKERYPVTDPKNGHGCDRSKALMDIVRAGIAALNDGSIVLPAPAGAKQQPANVYAPDNLEQLVTEIVQRQTEELKAELLGELAA